MDFSWFFPRRNPPDRRKNPAPPNDPTSASANGPQQDRRSRTGGRRKHPRVPIPFGSTAAFGKITTEEGYQFHAKLWDVSHGGFCVVSLFQPNLALQTPVTFDFQAGAGATSAHGKAIVVWVSQNPPFGQFTGLQFCEDSCLPNGNFLDRYLSEPARTPAPGQQEG